jgi:soluble lytic murein transglycosylase
MRPLLLAAGFALVLAAPAAAQPWAPDAQRSAGRAALAAANAGRFGEAESFATAADPLARKLVTWTRLQARGQGSSAELVAFVLQNPDWPFPDTVARRAEEALLTDPDDSRALAFFARQPARTLEGAQRHADALARTGRNGEVTALIRRAWAENAGGAEDAAFAQRHAALLRPEDHQRRFDRLAFARDFAAASRVLPFLDGPRRAAADARLAFAGERDVDSAAPRDLGAMAERARLLRRRERDAEAAQQWAAATPLQAQADGAAQRAIWTERQVLSRRLLRLGDARTAYRVAADHGSREPGEARQEAEFWAGFLALRRLNDAAGARAHFARVAEDSVSIITRARAAYWEGRALEAMGQGPAARERYAVAAALPTAFYGQLAGLRLGENPARFVERLREAQPAAPTRQAAASFTERELARAVLTLADLGDTRRARAFLLRLEDLSPDATDRVLIARLANHIGRPDHAVWIARRAGADGVMLLPEGWPTPFPVPPGIADAALVNAISRQESNFDTEAVSSANARGVMQLLPATAAGVARRLGIPHQVGQLTAEPAHNIRLGATYISERLAQFGGHPVLAAAAYNAGAQRVEEWLVTYGDPRAGVDLLDWMEQIPFQETRNYVQRVIENMAVYRARDPASAREPHPLAAWLPR